MTNFRACAGGAGICWNFLQVHKHWWVQVIFAHLLPTWPSTGRCHFLFSPSTLLAGRCPCLASESLQSSSCPMAELAHQSTHNSQNQALQPAAQGSHLHISMPAATAAQPHRWAAHTGDISGTPGSGSQWRPHY